MQDLDAPAGPPTLVAQQLFCPIGTACLKEIAASCWHCWLWCGWCCLGLHARVMGCLCE